MTKSFIKVLGLLLVVGLLFAALPTGQAQAATVVTTEAQLRDALAGTDTQIELGASFSLAATVDVNRSVSIDGKNFTITGPAKGTQIWEGHGLDITANDVSISNLTITSSGRSNLVFYNVTGGLVTNVTLSNAAHAGMIVNSSAVTISDVTTTNNTWGGINVDQGSGLTTTPLLTVLGVTTHTSPVGRITPAIWVDSGNAAWVGGEDGLYAALAGQALLYYDNAEFAAATVFNVRTGVKYLTIQAAIDAALAGDAIYVPAGAYTENVTINKALTLLGAGRDLVTLTGVNPTTDAGMLNIQASNVTIDGFKFVGAGYKTVRITQPTSNVTFSNNYVTGAEYTSGGGWILFETNYGTAQTNLTITGNTFENNGSQIGVYINPTHPGLIFTDNTFQGDPTLTGPVLGMDGMDGTEVISGNIFNTTSPYALFEGFGTPNMANIFSLNTWPAGYVVVGNNVMIAPPVHNVTQNTYFYTIQAAIDAADPTNVLFVTNGTYVESLNIYKSLTLEGESEAGVIIDARTFDDYGMDVYGDLITVFRNFTLLGHPTGTAAYGLKISGDAAVTTIDHVTVIGSRRSGIDLNGLNGSSVSNVTIQNSAYGVGLALTNCNNIAVSNVTTSGNAWGGMALYTDSTVYTQGSSGVSLSGTNSFGEVNKLYFDEAVGFPVTNFTQNTFFYTVKNSDRPNSKFFAIDLDSARAFALALATPLHSSIEKIADGSHYVFPGMSIQAAINASVSGDPIYIAAGRYEENVTTTTAMNKSVRLIGAVDGDGNAASTLYGKLELNNSLMDENNLIENIRFEQLPASVPYPAGKTVHDSLYLIQINGILIKNCDFVGAGLDVTGRAIEMDGASNGTDGVVVETCTFTGGYNIGIDRAAKDVTVRNSVFDGVRSGINLQSGTSNLVVENSTFKITALTAVNNAFGIRIGTAGTVGSAKQMTVTGSTFEINKMGLTPNTGVYHEAIVVRFADGVTSQVHNNSIVGGGIVNLMAGYTVDASSNWWGQATGPTAAQVVKFPGEIITCPYYTNELGTASYYPVTNTSIAKGFCTIQAAIDDPQTLDGHTIMVQPGLYAENIEVTKKLTLLGPNAAVNPITGTRGAEAVIQGSGNYASMVVLAEDVTVDGFTFDGQYLTDTYYTIGLEGDASGLTAQNNVFINHKDMAIMTTGVYYDGTAWKYDKYLDAVLLKDNLISNTTLSTSQYNFGIYFQSSLGTVSGNVVTNYRNGIQVQAYNTPGGGTISGNTFETYRTGIYFNYTENASANWLFEENDISGIAYPTGLTAERYNAVRVETMYAGSVAFEDNSILLGTSDATAKYQYFENNVTGGTRDASPNWWGSPCGPAAFSGTAVASPWYADAAMTTLKTATPAGDFSVTPDMTTVALNAALECATPGSTITFTTTSTDVDYPGGIVVPAGRDHLKLLLNDGVVLHGGSPCITVNADYTTIEADNLAMASCVTVAGSNGIDVADGVKNLVVDGLEIYGAGNDGIHFNGVITDVVLKDNYIHDLAGNGVFFGAQPVALTTGGIDIHGNLFQNNALNGIEAGAFTVPAEYNSWGNVGGAAAGDGASAGVDADPFTHVDLYLVSSGTPWADQVVSGQTITYTVMGHLVNANAADFVLTYPANLTYVSSTASGSFGTDLVTHTAGTRSLHFLGYSTTGNKTGTLPLFSVTFTAGAPVADAPMLLDELTDGFGMAAAGSSSNIYAAALLDSTVTIVTLPTISSTDIQGYYLTGEQRQFSVVLDNPVGGANYAHVYVDFTMTNAQVDQISLIEYSVDGGTTWVALGVGPGTSFANVGTDIVGYFGKMPDGGFALAPNTIMNTLFRVTFVTRDAAVDLPTSYAVSMKLMDADALPDPVQLAALSATMQVYDKPTVTYTSDPYFIVGEAGNFAVTITNPVTGKFYNNTAVFDVVLQGHVVADITAISCTDGTTTWDLFDNLTQDGTNVKARIGGLDGFFTIPAPLTVTLPCTVTYATAGTYTTSTSMVDVVSPLPDRVVSADIPGTATVYAKPVITPTNLAGPFDAGVQETVSLSIANTAIPEPFEVVFTYPAGTVIVYNGVTYTCAATCPVIPVDLTAEPTVLDFLVTFDEAWTGDVSVSLYDSDWTPADRLLATASATGAVVNGDFVVTGTFSMQGRASRAGIPVTLTWGGTLETYGPSASTIDVISNNFSLTLDYGGDYTLTTLQPRYLNVTAALGKTITGLAANRTMGPLELKGGNAFWRVSDTVLDNVIDTSDAGIVGGQYGTAGSDAGFGNHGDCNFDGKVNIQDLALVGGNYDLTSAVAYTTWMP